MSGATTYAQAATNASHAVGYPTLFVLVALGAIVPVIPTGALVSAAGVVAWHTGDWWALPLVFVVASAAALAGDAALYWLAKHGGERWIERLRQRADSPRLDAAQRRLESQGLLVLTLSRLVPAGRIPVMLACLFANWSVTRFVRADVLAALAWAIAYLSVGALGGSLFPEPWQGIAAVMALVLLVAAVPTVWRWVRERVGRKTVDSQPVG